MIILVNFEITIIQMIIFQLSKKHFAIDNLRKMFKPKINIGYKYVPYSYFGM